MPAIDRYIREGFIRDDDGKDWALNQWHPMPYPKGFANWHPILAKDGCVMGWLSNGCATHWLMITPPPLPMVKTQEQIDQEAFEQWGFTRLESFGPVDAWRGALEWLRRTGGKP